MKRTLCLLALAGLLTSCEDFGGSRTIEQRTIALSNDFTAIAVSNGADVIVDKNIAYDQVRVTTHEFVYDALQIKTQGGTLSIDNRFLPRSIHTFEVRVPAIDYNRVTLSGGSEFDWDDCTSESLTLTLSGGSDTEIKGYCKTLTVKASGGSDVKLNELHAEDVSIDASGGSDIKVYATNSLSVNASGGADIYYWGNPQRTYFNTSSSADIKKQ